MGCTNQKLHAQQIAYQRDFLGACWNSSLGDEEAGEYLASRWMGVSKEVMALYTNNHCFTVRTLNKDEKARANAAAAGKPGVKPPDDPTKLAPSFGGDVGGGGGRSQTPVSSISTMGSPSLTKPGKSPAQFCNSTSTNNNNSTSTYTYNTFPEVKLTREWLSSPARPTSLPLPPTVTLSPTTTPAHTTVRQNASHAHGPNSGNTANGAAASEHDGAANGSMLGGQGRQPTAEHVKKGADPAALRNVVKDSLESERVVHADHPYLQRHGLSVYGGVVFRCAPARRLYHRISLVPEANMKRLYNMQVTAMSRSIIGDPSLSPANPQGGCGGNNVNSNNETYHHFMPDTCSSESPRCMQSVDLEERGVPSTTQQVPPSNSSSMTPSPMVTSSCRPQSAPKDSSVNCANVTLLGSSMNQLPSLPLGAVSAKHLRFASSPEAPQHSAVIDAWAAESPLSTFNNYPSEDRDVAGVTAKRPPVIIGSITAMELQALPPNAEVCFGGWLHVSLQDEQERLRKSLKRYAARQRRRAAKAAVEDAARFSSVSSSNHRSRRSASATASQQRQSQPHSQRHGDSRSVSGVDEMDVEVEDSHANINDGASNHTFSLATSPSHMPTFAASPSSDSTALKAADGGETRVPTDGVASVTSHTTAFKDSECLPLRMVASSENDGGEAVRESASVGPDDALERTIVLPKSQSGDASPPSAITTTTAAAAGDAATSTITKDEKSARDATKNSADGDGAAGKVTSDKSANNHDNGSEKKVESAPAASSQPPTPTPTPPREHSDIEPPDTSTPLQTSHNATVAPRRTPSHLRARSCSMPPSPMMGAANSPAMPPTQLPLRHTGRYAREAMEADTLHASWLPYAYIIVAVPMYECSLVPTTFHTAFTRHKAVSLNLSNAQSRQAYGVGCITSMRYGGVMVIEYRDKINDEEDAGWIAELIRVGKAAQKNNGADADADDRKEKNSLGNSLDLSASGLFRHLHHSAAHRARAEKLRRIKSRIWHKLRRQGLHVVLAATRAADRRHRQQRASVANEVNHLFSGNYVDAAAAVMGASRTPSHFAANVRRTTSTLQSLPPSHANARRDVTEPVWDENLGVDEGGIGVDYGGGARGTEEFNEPVEDLVEDFDSTNSSMNSDSSDTYSRRSGSRSSSSSSYSAAERRNIAAAATGNGAPSNGSNTGAPTSVQDNRSSSSRKKGLWWRLAPSRHHHRRAGGSGGSGGGVNELTKQKSAKGRKSHRRRQRRKREGVTTREDRLRWTDPRMADDFYLRGTFRQIGGMKYMDVVSLMDGCPVSELVQGIKRWVVNLLSMPIKARPICLFLQRYEGIAASLRIIQSQLTATALAQNVASGKQMAQSNFSFHMPAFGLPGAEGAMSLDEVAGSFVSRQQQQQTEPIIDLAASSSALVNASFNALQSPMPQPTRALGYYTYYCGPLEPEVRAVLSPEVETMIALCQTRQLPDVLKTPTARAAAAAAATAAAAAATGNTEARSNGSPSTDNPLSPPSRELVSSRHSTLTHNTALAVSTARESGNVSKVLSLPSPTATASSAHFPKTPALAPDKALSNHSADPLSPTPNLSQAIPGAPHCSDANGEQNKQPTTPPPQLKHSDSKVINLSLTSSMMQADSAAATTQSQSRAVTTNVASLHGSFAAPSIGAKTTGMLETDATGHPKPPANTVPTTITECLLYDNPMKHDSFAGTGSFTANGQALAAAAAALILAENVNGPAAVTNGSFAASAINTGSFPAVLGPGDDSTLDVPRCVNGGSFDHVKSLREPLSNNNSFVSLGGDGSMRAGKRAVASPTTSAAKSKDVSTEEPQESSDGKPSPNQAKMGNADVSTSAFGKREASYREQAASPAPAPAARAPSTPPLPPPPQLLPAARSCNSSHDDAENSDDDSSDDGFNRNEAEERELEWQLADRELRALKSELDEMIHLTTMARSELLERLEELIQLGAVFLPHTRPDQVGLCLITMKMLRQYPEEVPVKEIHTDWVPLLMTLLTCSRANLFCAVGYDDGDQAHVGLGAQGFLTTYNNIADAVDMCDANKRREACDAGTTKYTVEPLPPMPAPRRLHDIVIAPQPVRFTGAMLQDMKRVGMDSEGLSFSFSGGSLGVLAGVLYYYGDFLRAKYRSEVAAVGGRAKDAGATVLDVLSRGGYNVLLRRIWIWGVTPETRKAKKSVNPATATKKLLQKRLAPGDDASSNASTLSTPVTADERDHVTANTASIGGGFVRVVGRPFRGSEAYALYDAIVHYLRTLEELCTEHHGSNSTAPQAPVKRRSVLMAWRRNKDNEAAAASPAPAAAANSGNGDAQNNNADASSPEDMSGARELVPTFEVCVATNYYYKRMIDEAHWPARSSSSRADGLAGLSRHGSTAQLRNGGATRHSSMADMRAGPPTSHDDLQTASEKRWRGSVGRLSEKGSSSAALPKPATAAAAPDHKHDGKDTGGSSGSHHESSLLERPYCGGEEMVKRDALQRKATKRFYGFLSDHYEQWRARHNDDKTTNAYGKRITISMN